MGPEMTYTYAKLAHRENIETAERRRLQKRLRANGTPIRRWWAVLLHRAADRLDSSTASAASTPRQAAHRLATGRTWCQTV